MSETVKLMIPAEKKTLMTTALDFIGGLQEVTIRNDEEYENAGQLTSTIKGYFNGLENDRKSLVKPFNDEVSSVNKEYKKVTTLLKNGEDKIKNAMGKYFQEQERIKAEKQRKLEAEAEAKRQAAEAQAAKEAAKVEQYRNEGRNDMADKAEARMECQIEKAATTVADEADGPKKVEGVSYRTDYEVSIEDKEKALQYILQNVMFIDLANIDLAEAKRLVKSSKGKIRIPGLRYVEKRTPVIRSR